jgi:hypothetical protein
MKNTFSHNTIAENPKQQYPMLAEIPHSPTQLLKTQNSNTPCLLKNPVLQHNRSPKTQNSNILGLLKKPHSSAQSITKNPNQPYPMLVEKPILQHNRRKPKTAKFLCLLENPFSYMHIYTQTH